VSSAAQEAAAALAPSMASELVEKIPVAGDDTLAADLAATGDAAAPVAVPSSQPQTAPAAAQAPVADPEVVEEFDLDLDPQIPDDLQQLLDEPDFDEEATLEVQGEIDDGEIDYTTDPEVAHRLKTLEKRNAWLEEQRVRSEKKKWVAENLKAYPLLARYAADEVAAIDATSRRGFARQAASLNGRLAKMVQPALQEIVEARKQLRGEVVQEVRAEYKDGWGDITTGPGVVPVEASAQEAEYLAAMKTGNLSKVIGVLMRAAGVNNT
jgi:hypothetical protein